MADFIKCVCDNCGAKYRLPIEYQGRKVRCKKCGEKFSAPKEEKTLEDSVLDWLTEAEEESAEKEEQVAQPRVINIPKEKTTENSDDDSSGNRRRGVIRMKTGSTDED